MVFIGVLGIYIGYIFNEVKHRPLYVVRTVLNKEKESGTNKESLEEGRYRL